ncbi:MAG: dCMP deaminase family protein [Planctomycetota bacterium]|jgi:dCMP deaminase|nr:dCMP deaminase family protein [Planctomycetota bacterium]
MTTDRPGWHEYFMAVAKLISTRSTCNSRPTGAILVKNRHILATGYNGSPPGAPHCRGTFSEDGAPFCYSRHMGAGDADKYNYCRSSHAEANAVAQAARLGVSIEGAGVYTTLAPCYICTKLLAAARIKEVYFEHDYQSADRKRDDHWKSIFRESGILVWERITLSPGALAVFREAFSGITSGRRLGEHPK